MLLWEQILIAFSAAVMAILGLLSLTGKVRWFARLVLLIATLMLAWLFFRFVTSFPPPAYGDRFFPLDLRICLTLLPILWLVFSLAFAREDVRVSLKRFRNGLIFAGVLAGVFVVLACSTPLLVLKNNFPNPHRILVTRLGQWYFLYLIVVCAMMMINLESTFRASWGIYRRKLRLPALVLGLTLIALLIFSSLVLLSGEMVRRFIAPFAVLCAISSISIVTYLRNYERQQSGVYIRSQAVYSSVAIIIIGFYLALAGAIGKIVQMIGGDIKLFITVLSALAVFFILLALLLSHSIQGRLKRMFERMFQSGQFDFEGELAGFSENVATIFSPEELTDKTLEILRDKLGVGRLFLFYADPHQDYLVLTYPREEKSTLGLRIAAQGPFADWLFRHGEAMVMEDLVARLSADKNEIPELESLSRLEIAITLPLIAKRKLVGMLFLGPKANREPFGHQEIQFISSIGHQFSLALYSARLSEELLAAKQIESFHKFTAFILHDLKNSVSMLSMLLQNYETNLGNLEFQKSAITTIRGAVQRMQLVMARLRSGEEAETFQISECNLNEIVLGLETNLQLGGLEGIEYKRQLAKQAMVSGDPEKLREVVQNLILNALEAMPQGGHLFVSTAEEKERVVLEVRDSGVGMTPEFISKQLFKPFATTKKKGLGIGLFQSKEWIEKMGGRILIKSAPGQGTAFSLIFARRA